MEFWRFQNHTDGEVKQGQYGIYWIVDRSRYNRTCEYGYGVCLCNPSGTSPETKRLVYQPSGFRFCQLVFLICHWSIGKSKTQLFAYEKFTGDVFSVRLSREDARHAGQKNYLFLC
jgi:hypothetical protein